jgi:hypothetical protein
MSGNPEVGGLAKGEVVRGPRVPSDKVLYYEEMSRTVRTAFDLALA